ncbi:MAG: histidine kinase [Spirochaetes bacterium]|nr:MAG: histidine kinase [Spirochaetota bacterium]
MGVRISDDGKGMDEALQARVLDPFFSEAGKHPGRKVGLGVPFLKQAVDLNRGTFSLESIPGRGTVVSFAFDTAQIDCPPMGAMWGIVFSLLCLPGAREMVIQRRLENEAGEILREYEVRRTELEQAIGSLEDVSSLALLKDFLRSQEEA